MISVPVLPISDAKHCIISRKALHVPTQSFASAHAKLCKCPRKALHQPTQSFAPAHTFFLRGKSAYILVTSFPMFFYRDFTWHKPC